MTRLETRHACTTRPIDNTHQYPNAILHVVSLVRTAKGYMKLNCFLFSFQTSVLPSKRGTHLPTARVILLYASVARCGWRWCPLAALEHIYALRLVISSVIAHVAFFLSLSHYRSIISSLAPPKENGKKRSASQQT